MSGGWFERLEANPHVEAVMIADTQGRILHSTRSLRSDQETVASMFHALEVLGQALSGELRSGRVNLIHLVTENSHILLFPLIDSSFFLVIEAERSVPLMLLGIELERLLKDVEAVDLLTLQQSAVQAVSRAELDAQELINAVQEWLRNRPIHPD